MNALRMIEIDFAKANKQADQIDQIAEKILKLSTKDMPNTLTKVGNKWKGNSASIYIKKNHALQDEVEKTAKELKKIASDIRTRAQRLYSAEMAAIKLNESSLGN